MPAFGTRFAVDAVTLCVYRGASNAADRLANIKYAMICD